MNEDSGFTLVEVLVTTGLMALVGALSLTALQGYAAVQDHQGTADEVVSVLRTTAQRSLSEGRTYCVHLEEPGSGWSVWQRSCTSGSHVSDGEARGQVEIRDPSFAAPVAGGGCPSSDACVYFFPRGTATPGDVEVGRDGTDDIVVTVEGLSSRVSRS